MLHVFLRAIDLFEALQEAARAAEAAKSIYKKALMNLIPLITLVTFPLASACFFLFRALHGVLCCKSNNE